MSKNIEEIRYKKKISFKSFSYVNWWSADLEDDLDQAKWREKSNVVTSVLRDAMRPVELDATIQKHQQLFSN